MKVALAWAHEGPESIVDATGIRPACSLMYTPGRSFHPWGMISRTVTMIAFWALGARWPPRVVD